MSNVSREDFDNAIRRLNERVTQLENAEIDRENNREYHTDTADSGDLGDRLAAVEAHLAGGPALVTASHPDRAPAPDEDYDTEADENSRD